MQDSPVRILLVESDPAQSAAIADALASDDPAFAVEPAASLAAALAHLRAGAWDAVVLDPHLPDSHGLASVAAVSSAGPGAALVLLVDEADEVLALKALQAGARDYLVKGQVFHTMLRRAVLHAVERERAARTLRETEERWRTVAMASNDTLWEYDPATDTHWWSEGGLRSLGYAPHELPRTLADWQAMIHPDDRALFDDSVRRGRRLGQDVWAREYRVRRRDGGYADVFDRGYITTQADGGRRVVGALMDLSDRRRAEDALRESEARHRRLFQTMAQGVLYVDRTGAIVDANPAVAELLGTPVEELRSHRYVDVAWDAVREDGSTMPAGERPSLVALRTGQEVDGVLMGVRRRDGTRRWLLAHARPQFRPGEDAPYLVYTTLTDITAPREAQDALAASEERLRLITDTVREAFYLIEMTPLRMAYLSPAFAHIWGIPREEMYEEGGALTPAARARFVDTIHPDDRSRQRGEMERRLLGEVVYGEYRIVRADGEVRWIADRSYPLRDADGTVRRIVGTAEDITERRLADDEVLRGREALTRIIETVTDVVVLIDADGTITFANPAAEKVFGIPREAMAGRHFAAIDWGITAVDGSAFPVERLPAARVLETGDPVFGVDHAVVRPDGSRAFLSINAAPLRGPGGEVEGVVATVRDVTASREAAERERFQATLLGAVGEAVAAVDLEGRVIYWNRHAAERTGWSAEEAVGSDVGRVVATADSEPFRALLRRVAAGGAWTGEVSVTRRDGSTYPAFLSLAPLRNAAGEAVGVVSASTDLTERKRLEAELQQAQRMEAVGRLAGGVAHDFNNILTSIQGYAQFIIDELSPQDPLRADAEEIRRAGDRAAALTRQLLAFSRKQVLQPRVLDLGAVVGGMERMLRRLIGEDVELRFAAPAALGRVRADPGQVEQVVLNLAVNARDAMPDGGLLRIELDEEDRADGAGWVVLRVADTGTGIGATALPHVFEPFFTTKPAGVGTGLGLSTVYGIVTQSGGTVEVRSEPGAGTTFEVRLPRVAGDAEAEARPAAPVAVAGGETVLLVEDDAAVRALAARILRRQGYRVLEADDGDEAILACERHPGPIDLMVTDVVMPKMSGGEMAERAAALRPGMRVLFMSGYTDDIVARHGVLEDGRMLVEKPFSPATLAARVRALLDTPPPRG